MGRDVSSDGVRDEQQREATNSNSGGKGRRCCEILKDGCYAGHGVLLQKLQKRFPVYEIPL